MDDGHRSDGASEKRRRDHRDRRDKRDQEDRKERRERKDVDGHRRSEKNRRDEKSRRGSEKSSDRRERREGKGQRDRRDKHHSRSGKTRGSSDVSSYHRSHELRGKETAAANRVDVRNLVSMWENIAVKESEPQAPNSARATREASQVSDRISPETHKALHKIVEKSPAIERRRSKGSHKMRGLSGSPKPRRKDKKDKGADRTKALPPLVRVDPGSPQLRSLAPIHTHTRRTSWDRSEDRSRRHERRISVGSHNDRSRILRNEGSTGKLERRGQLDRSKKLSPRTSLTRAGPISSSSNDVLAVRSKSEECADEDALLIEMDEGQFDIVARWHESPTAARPGDLCQPSSASTWHLERGGDDIVIGWPGNTSGGIALEDGANFTPLYKKYCYGEEHHSFWGICEGLGPVVITVQADGLLDETRSSLFSSPKRPSLKPWKTPDLTHKRSSSSAPFGVDKERAGAPMPAPLPTMLKTSDSALLGSSAPNNSASEARRASLGTDPVFQGRYAIGSPLPLKGGSKGSKKKKGDLKLVARVIVRSKNGIQQFFMKTRPGKKEVKRALKTALPQSKRLGENAELGKMKLQSFKGVEGIEDVLLNLEEKMLVNRYKFGVLYVKTIPTGVEGAIPTAEGRVKGDVEGNGGVVFGDELPIIARRMQTENEMFQNNDTSKEFVEFLDLIGDRVTLKGFEDYRGGLDVTSDATGPESYYTKFQDSAEIMFHVSTMLPFFPADEQQVERKRHLGNDIACIVFIDDDGDDKSRPPWDPDVLTNQFNHVIAVVRKARRGKYHIECATKVGVRPYAPLLPKRNRVKAGELRDFLLTKLVNGERATMRSPEFLSKLRYTRLSHLQEAIPDDKK